MFEKDTAYGPKTGEQIAMKVSRICIYVNVFLSAFKLFAGIFGQSSAMVSDAVHSLSDIFGTIIVMVGIRLANRRSDKDHQYGHERFECVAALLLGVILFATGAGIGWTGAAGIVNSGETPIAIPSLIALIAAVVSIIVKEAMYWYTRAAAKKIDSTALMAEAWHHRSDAFSSIGSFAGIFGARLGLAFLDPLAGMVICLFIIKAAIGIFGEAIGKMTDKACDENTTDRIREIILEHESIEGIDQLKTRQFGNRIYVDVDISVNGSQTVQEAHEAAHTVHDAVERHFPNVKHCMVHVNPVVSENAE